MKSYLAVSLADDKIGHVLDFASRSRKTCTLYTFWWSNLKPTKYRWALCYLTSCSVQTNFGRPVPKNSKLSPHVSRKWQVGPDIPCHIWTYVLYQGRVKVDSAALPLPPPMLPANTRRHPMYHCSEGHLEWTNIMLIVKNSKKNPILTFLLRDLLLP
jgi:hypothetical protein